LGLGWFYSNGHGVPQNYGEAAKWYRLAADQGNSSAQFNLGIVYFIGQGVPKNYVRAHVWLNLAAAHGDDEYASMRDAVEELMTTEQVAEAQHLATLWQPGTKLDDLQ